MKRKVTLDTVGATAYTSGMKRKTRKKTVVGASISIGSARAQPFEYARVERALARVYQAEHVREKAFRGRLKHFRKLGIPNQNPGKGGRVRYSASDVFQLMVCLELSEFGLDPNLIVKLVQRHWSGRGYFTQTIDVAQRFVGNDFYAVLHANFMSWTWGEKFEQGAERISYQSGLRDPVHFSFPKESDLPALLQRLREEGQRVMIFNLSARVREVEQTLRQAV